MISESREGTLALIMPLVWCQQCGGERPAVALVTGSACASCRTQLAAISPLERYLSAAIAGAVIKATRAPDAPGSAGLAPHPHQTRSTGMSSDPTEITVRPITLHAGDKLVRHPDAPAVHGEWTLTAEPSHDGWFTRLDYRDAAGKEGVFILSPGVPVRVRVTPPEVA